MAVNQKKSKIIDKIKLYMTIADSDIDLRSFETLLSQDNDPLNFLFLIYKTVEGENQLEALTEYMLRKVIKQSYLDSLQNKFYNLLLKKIPENLQTPTQFSNPGMSMPVKSFDLTDSFKNPTNPAAQTPNRLYQDIQNYVLAQANQDITLNLGIPGINASVLMNYNESKKDINIKLPALNAKDLFLALTVYIGPLFSANVFVKEIINLLFHTDFTEEDAKIIIMTRSYAKYETKDVFKLDLNKLLDLELDTEKKGLNVDASCFRENIEVTTEQIEAVANEPTISNFKLLIPEYNTETKSNILNDYYVKISEAIIDCLLAMFVKQPIVLFISNLISKILNLDFNFSTEIPELFDNLGEFFKELWDEIYKDFLCILLNFISKILLKIVIFVTIKLIKEQLKKRQEILLSLSGSRFASAENSIGLA
jgi:hypothetical protein